MIRRMDTQVVELLGPKQLVDELVRAGPDVIIPFHDQGVDVLVCADLVLRTRSLAALLDSAEGFLLARLLGERTDERSRNVVLAFVWNIRMDQNCPMA